MGPPRDAGAERSAAQVRAVHARGTTPWALGAPATVAVLFLLVPLAALLVRAPWSGLVRILADSQVVDALRLSLLCASAATALSLVFGVPLRGSVLLLLAEGLLFILVALSLGILISARTSSQRVAMLGAMLITMLPTQILSGFIFPLDSMPRALQWLANVVPAKWFVIIARGIMLKGVGLGVLWPETLALAAMAAVLVTAASRSFSPRLE